MKLRLLTGLLLIGPFLGAALFGEGTDQRVEAILKQMTLEEKIDYIGGHNAFSIREISRLGVPELKMADGPMGVCNCGPSISYPGGICAAASWDTALVSRLGAAMGQDARARGVHILLAPGMNIYRAPMCGRNFEYFGEDPFLTSKMAVAMIKGIQSQGVVATAKHFAGNNQEWDRDRISSDIDERTLREIYLPAFEASVKEGHVGAIMNSYNLINGEHATQHGLLNNTIAKNEWGFQGILMSDWNSTYDGIAAANNGLDLEMPFAKCMNKETLLPAIQSGQVSEETINDKVRRILRTSIGFGFLDRSQTDTSISFVNKGGLAVARELAHDGMVLLKNDGVLPFKKKTLKTIAVIGPNAQAVVPQGGGSSLVTPLKNNSFLDAISATSATIFFSRGVPDTNEPFALDRYITTQDRKQIGFVGEYFDNEDLVGVPKLIRIDPRIHFRWGESQPLRMMRHYSVRWTGYFTPPISGDVTFYLAGSGGFRLYVDDNRVVDRWNDKPGFEDSCWKTAHLKAGKQYKICVEHKYTKEGVQSITFGFGMKEHSHLADAKRKASLADAVILCVGFDKTRESEGIDRCFSLPAEQNQLIKEVLSVNKNVVVVTSAGGSIDMSSWVREAPAILHVWYPGQEGGEALCDILFGDVCPSGKLPITFEQRLEDNASYHNYYDAEDGRVPYKEGIFVGYRHFEKEKLKPLFPFGYGLSYTTFAYSNLKVVPLKDGTVSVSFNITNTGKMTGAEVAQVYVRDTHARVQRPEKELKGFGKVLIPPGKTRKVYVSLDKRAFSYYDVETKSWTMDPGMFTILVGRSSAQIELSQAFCP